MTDSADDRPGGNGKPPKPNPWTKARKRNRRSKRRSSKQPETMAEIIDRLLTKPVQVTINGTPSRMTALEAILQQLIQKWLSGHSKALAVLLDYRRYFERGQPSKHAKVIFLNPHTESAKVDEPPETSHV